MLSELRKSNNSVLFERVTSPLFGTLIVSWLIWNWKIIYLSLFISESQIKGTKIDFISKHYSDPKVLILYPLISTAVLLIIVPFVSNGAYWLSLTFKKWRVDQKNKIEKKQLLSIEQSVALRNEIRGKEIEFEKILEKENQEKNDLLVSISDLNEEVHRLKKIVESTEKSSSNHNVSNGYGPDDFTNLKKNKIIFEPFEKIAKSIKEHKQFSNDINEKIKEYYLINGIVEIDRHFEGETDYKLTFKGEGLYRDFFNENFANGIEDK